MQTTATTDPARINVEPLTAILDAYTRAKLAIELKGLFAAKAKENQGTRVDILQNSAKCIERIDTRQELARIAGTSHDTIAKVERIPGRIG